jgi:hypothetical protein
MPGIKEEFDGYDPVTGRDRLADFLEEFRHYDYITSLGPKKFEERFNKWAKKFDNLSQGESYKKRISLFLYQDHDENGRCSPNSFSKDL